MFFLTSLHFVGHYHPMVQVTNRRLLQFINTLSLLLLGLSTAHGYRPPPQDVKLSKLFTDMFESDPNRADPGRDWRVNLQGSLSRQKGDQARQTFFSFVDEKLFSKPTYKSFIKLLDNYSPEVGVNEVENRQEKQEIDQFLNSLIDTVVFQKAHHYLVQQGLASSSKTAFKKQLHSLWFDMYGRRNKADTSGFEHVFVGETKKGEIIGFHNWIQFYLQEKAGKVDYLGYYKKKCYKQPRAFVIGFKWNGMNQKNYGSIFVGMSPEFEMALYTVTYLVSEKANGRSNKWNPIYVKIGPCNMQVQCYKSRGDHIGTCYAK